MSADDPIEVRGVVLAPYPTYASCVEAKLLEALERNMNMAAALRSVDAGLEKLAEGAPVAWSRIGRLRIDLRETVSDTRILMPLAADLVAEIERLSRSPD